jgi:hypothetical protein
VLGYNCLSRLRSVFNNNWGYTIGVNANNYIALRETIRTSGISDMIGNDNKLYMLIYTTNPSDGTIASQVSLDNIKLIVALTRQPDVVAPISVNASQCRTILFSGFSPAYTESTAAKVRTLWYLKKDANNYSQLTFDSTTKKFNYIKCVNGVVTTLSSATQTFNKWQVYNIECSQTNAGMVMRLLKNAGTIEKVSNTDTTSFVGQAQLYSGTKDVTGSEADAWEGIVRLLDLEKLGKLGGFGDAEALAMLNGTAPGYENPNLVDMSKITLHSNAAYDAATKTITLNATAGYQNSTIIIPVLPNNRYEIAGILTSSSGSVYVAVNEYYNNIKLKTDSGVISLTNITKTFVTTANTNKLEIRTQNLASGTFTFSNIELRRKD